MYGFHFDEARVVEIGRADTHSTITLSFPRTQWLMTPLAFVIAQEELAKMKILLSAGAKVTSRNEVGVTLSFSYDYECAREW